MPPVSEIKTYQTDKHTRILEAATQAVLDRGVDGARLRDVARHANVSIGLIQHYFGSREELFAEAVRSASEQLINSFRVDESLIADPWERILAMIDRWVTIEDLTGHSSVWLHFAEAARRSKEMQELFHPIYWQWYDHAHRAVSLGVDNGTMSPLLDTDNAVEIFMTFFDCSEVEIATGIIQSPGDRLRTQAEALATALFRPHHAQKE